MPGQLLQNIDEQVAVQRSSAALTEGTGACARTIDRIDWIYHSNAIDSATLTLRETRAIVEGTTLRHRSVRDHFRVLNHLVAILYVEDLIAKQEALRDFQVLEIHRTLYKGIDDRNAGRCRHGCTRPDDMAPTRPDSLHVPSEMRALLEWFERTAALHPVSRAAELLVRFERISPFVEGNGVAGRVLMNYPLLKASLPPAVIHRDDRPAYDDALKVALMNDNPVPITRLVALNVARALEAYMTTFDLRKAHQQAPALPSIAGMEP